MAVVKRKCARRKAAPHSQQHVASASSMVLVEHASLMVAQAVRVMDLNIASNTVVGRRTSRAPWQAALPPHFARVSVANTAVGLANAGLQVAPT